MTAILAIDPGTTESAWVTYHPGAHRLTGFDKCPNRELLDLIVSAGDMVAVIERIESYGMPVGAEVFQTVQWTGRFIERMESCGVSWVELPRKAVTLHLCDSVRAKDSNVRQALLDRFPGPLTPKGRPTKGHPLKGVSGDVWAALAVAVTWADQDIPRRQAWTDHPDER